MCIELQTIIELCLFDLNGSTEPMDPGQGARKASRKKRRRKTKLFAIYNTFAILTSLYAITALHQTNSLAAEIDLGQFKDVSVSSQGKNISVTLSEIPLPFGTSRKIPTKNKALAEFIKLMDSGELIAFIAAEEEKADEEYRNRPRREGEKRDGNTMAEAG